MLKKISIYQVRFGLLLWAIATISFGGSLQAQSTAVEEDIRGAKPLVEIPEPKKSPVILWITIGTCAVLLGVAVVLWKKQTSKQNTKSAREIAMSSLSTLEANREGITPEAFANRVAQTVRLYISDCFGIAATRRTTEEFFADLTQHKNSLFLRDDHHLRNFLVSCDLAKFAGSDLDLNQRDILLQAARGVITSSATPVSNNFSKSPVI